MAAIDLNSSNLENKRKEFRKYLEATGVTEKLTTALMKLYQEESKPVNPIEYIRRILCDENDEEEEVSGSGNDDKEMEAKNDEELIKEKEVTEIDKEEKEEEKCDVKKTDSEVDLLLNQKYEALKADESGSSLLKEYLNDEIFEKLKSLKTEFDGTLFDNIKSGLTHFDSETGIFASDQHAYETFESLFIPVLEDLHDIDGETTHPAENDFGDSHELDDIDPEGNFIKSIRIIVGRSLNNHEFIPLLTDEKLKSIEDKMRNELLKIEDDEFKGNYHSLSEIEDEQKNKWIEDGIFQNPDDKFLKAADSYRCWPKGRGIFMNEKKNFRVLVNHEEHIQMISCEDGANLQNAYERLSKGMKFINELEFAKHERFGYLAHNLRNIGNAMRIIVNVKISKLSLEENSNKFDSLLETHHIKATKLDNGQYELMNLKRVGITEIEAAREFQKGVKEIITAEKCLYL